MKKNKTTKPIYQLLIDDLKKSIVSGRYKPGDLLPSENDLSREYNTTRVTVRQALKELTNMGYIFRQHGKGSIVCEAEKGLGILSLKGVTAGVGSENLKTFISDKPRKMEWPENFPYDLSETEKKYGCIYFSRIRIVNELPVLYEETFIANYNIPKFTNINLENKSLFKTLSDHYDIEIKSGEHGIWSIKATTEISKILKTPKHNPILHLKRKLYTNKSETIIYSYLYCNTTDYYLKDYF